MISTGMLTVGLLLLGSSVFAASQSDATPEPAPTPVSQPVVLVTAYGPFAGRGVNGSDTIASALDGRTIAGHRIATAVLPVTWGEPQRQLPGLIAEHQPVLVIGLGEGWPGRIAVEHVGYNQQAGRDERGADPATVTIETDGPDLRRSRLHFDAAWFSTSRIPVVSSEDAGRYLCNSLLYSVLGATNQPAGFVHLPPQGDVASNRYRQVIEPVIVGLIERNLASAASATPP